MLQCEAASPRQDTRRIPVDPYTSALEDEILLLRAANRALEAARQARRASDAELSVLLAEGMMHARALLKPPAIEDETTDES